MFLRPFSPPESAMGRIVCIRAWRDTLAGEGNAVGRSMRIIIADTGPAIKCFSLGDLVKCGNEINLTLAA
jgi:hypothetical protein